MTSVLRRRRRTIIILWYLVYFEIGIQCKCRNTMTTLIKQERSGGKRRDTQHIISQMDGNVDTVAVCVMYVLI